MAGSQPPPSKRQPATPRHGRATPPAAAGLAWAPCRRSALLHGTALRAAAMVVLASPTLAPTAAAQIAASTRPTGGMVVGGAAKISQSGSGTTIDQTSEQAAINWQSFNVGSQQTVTFDQPNSRAVALNTVVGPNPSEIAGRITANGQVVIVNQSGVVFDHGAQVDTAGLVVSAAGITTKNFMAGHMVFDQAAHAGARIVNAGTLTVRQAGLAALVAPQVANASVIQARLGRVVLAGAATYTLDLYGDGLLALNVTGQVTAVTLGNRTVPALVTNIGTIVADGGTVLLTAAAADGLIRTLVNAGGTIAADSVGAKSGQVLVQGIGGSVEIDGAVSASGLAAGTSGGQVVADATGAVTIAAGASIDASGQAGGGLIAIGTTAARAAGGPHAPSGLTAASTSVAAGARLSANAWHSGNGGRVTLLSTGQTNLAGAVSVLGGASSGNGGSVEVSGETVGLTGAVDAGAAHGHVGGLLIDPTNIYVASGSPTLGNGDQAITPASLEAENADITLAATNAVDFAFTAGGANSLELGAHALTVTAGAGGVNVDAGFSIGAGNISLTSNGGAVALDTTTGVGLGLGAASTGHAALTGGAILLQGNGVALAGASVTGTTSLQLTATNGDITQSTDGVITTPLLSGTSSTGTGSGQGQALLIGSNQVGTVTSFTTDGDLTISNATALLVFNPQGGGALTAGSAGAPATLELTAPTLEIASTLTALGGTVALRSDMLNFAAFETDGVYPVLVTTGTAGLIALDTDTDSTLSVPGFDPANGAGLGVFIQTPFLALGSLDGRTPAGHVSQIDLVGGINLSAGDTLGLFTVAGGTVLEQSEGTGAGSSGITASALVGNVGTLALTSGNDAIGSIGNFTAETFQFSQPGALSITGAITSGLDAFIGSQGSLTVTGQVVGAQTTLVGSNVTISGQVVGETTLGLTATAGNINATGNISTAMLSGSATGGVTLTGSNNVQTLADFTAGNLVLDDTGPLSISGRIDAPATIATTGSLTLSGTLTTGANAAGSATLTGASIAIPGTIVTASDLTLNATAGGISEPGSIAAGTLSGSATGAAAFTGVNDVTDLGDFTAAGFSFAQADPLNVTGTVSGGTATSIASSLALTVSGNVSGATTSLAGDVLTLTEDSTVNGSTAVILTASAGSIDDAGALNTTLLTGSAAGSAVLTGFNQIASLGAFNAFSLNLQDEVELEVSGTVATTGSLSLLATNLLTVDGAISGGAVALNVQQASMGTSASHPLSEVGAGMVINGSVTGTTSLALTSYGGITATGSLATPLLSGQAGTGASLTGSNLVTSLGSFTAANGFALNDAAALTISGPVAGGTAVDITDTASLSAGRPITADSIALQAASLTLTDGAQINASTALSLIATGGGISQTGGGITTPQLSGSATGAASLAGVNSIASLGDFTAGSLALNDTVALTVAGSLTAASTALTATAITLSGSITATSLGLVATAGNIDDRAAVISAGTLTGSATGNALITGASTSIGTLGNFTAGDDFSLGDLDSLTFAGNLTAGGIDVQAPSMTIAGSLSAGSLTLTASGGGITETPSGVITSDILLVSSAGAATFPGANAVSALEFSAGSTFSLNDTVGLTVENGQVAGPGTPTLLLSAPSINIPNNEEGSAISAPGGTIGLGANTLTLQSVVSTGTTGLVGLTSYSVDTLTLTTANAAEFVTGELSVGSLDGITPSPQVTAIVLPTGLNLTGVAGTLGLFTASGGSVVSTAGITASTLVGNAGRVSITGPNEIADIGNFTAQSFTFAQAGALDITGTLNGGAALNVTSQNGLTVDGLATAAATSLTGAGLTINGSATGSASLNLVATAGDITAFNGTLTTGLLTGSASGEAFLTGANTIATLGNFSAGDVLELFDTGNLAVTGNVSGNPLEIEAAALTLTGNLTARLTTELIADTGAIDAPAGSVTSPNLYVSAAGSAVFTGSNQIGSLTFGNTGSFVLTDIEELVVFNSITTAGSAGASPLVSLRAPTLVVTYVNADTAPPRPPLTDAAPRIDEADGLSAPGGTIALSADTLSLQAGVSTGGGGLVGLATYQGSVLTLTSGNTAEIDTGELSVGSLNGITPSPLVTSIVLPDALNLTGIAGTLGLFTAAGGTVTSSTAITAGTLVGNAGTVSLTGANSIADIGDFAAQDLTFAQAGDLSVSGAVGGGAAVSLSTGGSLTVSGQITAAATQLGAATGISISGGVAGTSTLSLTVANGGITAPGTLASAGLTGQASGAASLTGANTVTGLGDFSATAFTLNDTDALVISGTVAGSLPIAIDAAAITLNGALRTADTISLTANAGGITGAGMLSASALSGSATGSVTLIGPNQVTSLGDFAASGFSFSDAADLNVTGSVNGGSATILQAGGALTLAAGAALSGTAVSIDATSVTLAGSIAAPGSLSLAASDDGNITSTGPISAGLLAFSTGGTVDLAGSNQIAALGSGSAGSLNLADAAALDVQGTISAGGAAIADSAGLTVSGSLVAPTATLTAPTITVTGALTDTTSLTLAAGTGGIAGAGQISTPMLQGSASGSVTLSGGNQISGIGSFTAAGFSLTDAAALTVSGPLSGGASATIDDAASLSVTGSIDAGSVALSASAISLPGSLNAPTSLSLTATQSGAAATITGTGSISTGLLSATSGGLFSLTGGNQIAALGNVTSSGFTLDNLSALSVGGALQGGQLVTISDAGSLNVTGSITGNASGGEILLGAGGTITLAGMLSAPTIHIGAPASDSTEPAASAATAGSAPSLVVFDGGSLAAGTVTVTADDVVQTGVTRINQDGAAGAISITLAGNGGSASFAPGKTAGLIAPSSSLSLALGTGTASGNVDVSALSLSYTSAAMSVSQLTGSIGGVTGSGAAAIGQVQPAISAQYQFNGCTLGAASCTVVITQPTGTQTQINEVPIFVNPASGGSNDDAADNSDFGVAFGFEGGFAGSPRSQQAASYSLMAPFSRERESARRRHHDDDLIIPNISAEDF